MKNDDLISRSALGIGRCNPDAFPEQNRGYVAGWNGVVALIEAAPAVDAVSRSVFEQVKWERDCAMQQLKEHGIPFGGIAPAVDDREKMVELIEGALEHASKQCEELDSCCACPHGERGGCQSAFILDYLISNGVTFAKDTDVPSKWISVEDRLPEEARVPKDVLVYHKLGNCGSYVDRAWYDRDKRKWRSALGMNMKVTHWMPMPEPPRVQGVPNGTDHV